MLLEIMGLESRIKTRGAIVHPARGVSLGVGEGECLGIAGESGCGKTVLLLSIMRLMPPGGLISSGEILFEGRDLVSIRESEMRTIRGRRIAMVFQEPMTALNPVLTIGNQLIESIRRGGKHTRESARGRAIDLLQDTGIHSAAQRMQQYPHELSGGMRQRVMLAMALASGASLILADEPTSALDVTVQARIVTLLHALRSKYNLSLIFVSHDLALLSQLCDRIAIMYLGRIVEIGSADEIVTGPQHPYTEALLECAGRSCEDGEGVGFKEIPGELPDGSAYIPGCQFHPRCPLAVEQCRLEKPELKSVTPTHFKACFRTEVGALE